MLFSVKKIFSLNKIIFCIHLIVSDKTKQLKCFKKSWKAFIHSSRSISGVPNSTVVKNASVEWEERKVGDPVDDLGYELRVNVYRDSVCRRLSWFDSRFSISSSTSRESITGYRIRFQLSYLFVSRVYQPVFLQVP